MTDEILDQVFISYVSEDRALAVALAEALRAEGVHVWQDVHNLRLGDQWRQEIEDAVRSSRLVLVLWTERAKAKFDDAVREPFFGAEVRLAIKLGDERADDPPYAPLTLDRIEPAINTGGQWFPIWTNAGWAKAEDNVAIGRDERAAKDAAKRAPDALRLDAPYMAELLRKMRFTETQEAPSGGSSGVVRTYLPRQRYRLANLPPVSAVGRLIGRDDDLADLKRRWREGSNVYVLQAMGGAGKTALTLKFWHDLINDDAVERGFAWSFYSQGVREASQTTSAAFFEALEHELPQFETKPGTEQERARQMARWIAERQMLIVLDGLEPLQRMPDAEGVADLLDAPLEAFIEELTKENSGMCLITTRFRIGLFRTGPGAPQVIQSPLRPLPEPAAIELLKRSIDPRAAEEDAAGREYKPQVVGEEKEFQELVSGTTERGFRSAGLQGHALSIVKTGRFIREFCKGDIRRARDMAPTIGHLFSKHRERVGEGVTRHVNTSRVFSEGGRSSFGVFAAYEEQFEVEITTCKANGETDRANSTRGTLALMRLMGLFDRPVSIALLRELCRAQDSLDEGMDADEAEALDLLIGPLRGASDDDLKEFAVRLTRLGVLSELPIRDVAAGHGEDGDGYDAHPLVREYFAARLQDQITAADIAAWRAEARAARGLPAAAPPPPEPRPKSATERYLEEQLGRPLAVAAAVARPSGLEVERWSAAWSAANFRLYIHWRNWDLRDHPQFQDPIAHAVLAFSAAHPDLDPQRLVPAITSGQISRDSADNAPPTLLFATPEQATRAKDIAADTETLAAANSAFQPSARGGYTPVLAAIAHGCAAGRPRQTYLETYHPRIARGAEFWTWHKLGAPDLQLAALSSFFSIPFAALTPRLGDPKRDLPGAIETVILNDAAMVLTAIGRLSDALRPRQKGAELLNAAAKEGDAAGAPPRDRAMRWINASIAQKELSLLQNLLGEPAREAARAAVAAAEAARTADENADWAFHLRSSHSQAAEAALNLGDLASAEADWRRAEDLLQAHQPGHTCLYSTDAPPLAALLRRRGAAGARRRAATLHLSGAGNGWVLAEGLGRGLLGALDSDAAGADAGFDAVEAARQVMHLPQAHLWSAEALRRSGAVDEALKALERAEKIAVRSEAAAYFAPIAVERGRLALAMGDDAALAAAIKDGVEAIKKTGHELWRLDLQILEIEHDIRGGAPTHKLQKALRAACDTARRGDWAFIPDLRRLAAAMGCVDALELEFAQLDRAAAAWTAEWNALEAKRLGDPDPSPVLKWLSLFGSEDALKDRHIELFLTTPPWDRDLADLAAAQTPPLPLDTFDLLQKIDFVRERHRWVLEQVRAQQEKPRQPEGFDQTALLDAARAALADEKGRAAILAMLAQVDPEFDVETADDEALLARAAAVLMATAQAQQRGDDDASAPDPGRLLRAMAQIEEPPQEALQKLFNDNPAAIADLVALGQAQDPPIDVMALGDEQRTQFILAAYAHARREGAGP